MPQSLLKFLFVAMAISVLFSCGGPQEKPEPPDKTTPMEVAKGDKTTDMPDVEPGEEPMAEPGEEPMAEPGEEPMAEPGEEPAAEPVEEPAAEPVEPGKYEPGEEPAEAPAEEPGEEPAPEGGVGVAPVDPGKYGTPDGAPEEPTEPEVPEVPEEPMEPEVPEEPTEPGEAPAEPGEATPPDREGIDIDEYIKRMLAARDGVPRAPSGEPTTVARPVDPTKYGVPPADIPTEPGEVEPGETVPDIPDQPIESLTEEELAQRRLRELEEKESVKLQYQEYLTNYYLSQAERLKKELRFPEAEEWALRALKTAPDNQKAIALYHEILGAQGKRTGEIVSAAEELEKLHQVKTQEAQTKANYHFSEGKRASVEGRYDDAITHFENVLTIIEVAPYGADWGTLKADTERLLFDAKQKKAAADEVEARAAARAALEQVKGEELRRKAEENQRVQKLLMEGLDAFEKERFETAELLAEKVLALDPMNARAKQLLEESVRARHAYTDDKLLRVLKERFREWKLDIRKSSIPWSSRPLHWPSQKDWDRVTRRAHVLSDFGGGTEMSADDRALKNTLSVEKVTFQFEGAPLTDALEFIRTLKGINIVVDDAVKSDLEGAPINLAVTDLELDSAMDLLLKLAGADYTYIIRDGVVFVTNKEGARGEAILRVHTVGDLTIRLTNFVAPNLILKPAGAEIDEETPLFGKAEEGEQLLGGGAEELMDLIQGNIAPESWDGDEYSINVSGETKLVVVHTPEVQREVGRFLDDLRKFAGLVVTIESRFLTVNDDFLQDIGVDIRGLGGEKGPLVNLDDVSSGLEDNASAGFDNGNPGLPVASASNPSAGVFFNQNSDGDYRGRTEHLFDQALGQVLTPLGGALIQYTFLDDTNVSFIMKAVEKSRHARFLQAPSLTVYNTQRANITVVNQLSFIQDFDVEVAQTAFIADPIVNIIQDGLSLDVRPTISHDRKYVTLELQPIIATLVRPIPTFQTSLGALTTPVTIQIPELIIQKSQTTVRVPDGGSLVIGGLKNISLVDLQSEVPFLAKIPILNFFFSRKGSSKEVQNLMIIVTARITDLVEEEMRFRSPLVR